MISAEKKDRRTTTHLLLDCPPLERHSFASGFHCEDELFVLIMLRRVLIFLIAATTGCFLLVSCNKDDGVSGPSSTSRPSLTANPGAVSVTSGQNRSVSVYGGTNPYLIAQSPNQVLAAAQISNPNQDTIVVLISGSVTTATGSTAVIIKDASSPQKSVTIAITKTQ